MGFDGKLGKMFGYSIGEELRMQNSFQTMERSSTSLGVDFKPFSFLKVGATYELMYQQYEKRNVWQWEWRQRAHLSLTGYCSPGRWNFSLRERLQSTFRESKNWENPKIYLRSRFQAEYDIRKSHFTPYASAEMYYTLFPSKAKDAGMNRWRFLGGCEYKLDKRNRLDFFYRYTLYTSDDRDDANGHFIGIAYTHKLKSK